MPKINSPETKTSEESNIKAEQSEKSPKAPKLAKTAKASKLPQDEPANKDKPAKQSKLKSPRVKGEKGPTKRIVKKEAPSDPPLVPSRNIRLPGPSSQPAPASTGPGDGQPKKLSEAVLSQQKQKLLDLRDNIVSQMHGVARETLRGTGEGSDSAFGMHQADAGSDSYDRDFALNLLSKEQDALYEIDEALHRIEKGTYGICEESGEIIPQMRLEAMPFARLTVVCQEKRDKEQSFPDRRQPVTSLFGLEDKEKTISDED